MQSDIGHLTGADIHYRLTLLNGSTMARAVARQLPNPAGVWPEIRLTVEWVSIDAMEAIQWEREPGAPLAGVALETVVASEMGCVFLETDAFVITGRIAALLAGRSKPHVTETRVQVKDWFVWGRIALVVTGAVFGAGFTLGVYVGQKAPALVHASALDSDHARQDRELREIVADLKEDVADVKKLLRAPRPSP